MDSQANGKKEIGAYTIAKIQNIIPKWEREVYKKYRDGEPEFKKPNQ